MMVYKGCMMLAVCKYRVIIVDSKQMLFPLSYLAFFTIDAPKYNPIIALTR